MNKFNFSKAIPYLLALPIFYLATFSLFYPELSGKLLQQTDIVQFEGMKSFSNKYAGETGETALWNIGMFSGFPEYLMSGYPSGGMDLLEKATSGFLSDKWSAHILFRCFFCAWVMLLCFRVNPYIAIAGGVTFGLTTYNIVTLEAGHFTKIWAIACSGLVIGGMALAFRRKYLLGALLFALGVTMQLRSVHYQIVYYTVVVCLVYAISESFFLLKEKNAKQLLVAGLLLLLGVGLSGITQVGRLWGVSEYTPYSIRGERELRASDGGKPSSGYSKDDAFSWSEGKIETLTLLVPYLYGGSSHEKPQRGSAFMEEYTRVAGQAQAKNLEKVGGILPMYHGDQPFTSGPAYAGAIVCFLFVLGMVVLDNRQRVWMGIAALLAMMIAWGGNFPPLNHFLFDYIPGFNKFRSPSMALSLTILLMVLLGSLGLTKFLEREWNAATKKQLLLSVGLIGGLALLIALGAGMMQTSAPRDADTIARMFGGENKQLVNTFVDALQEDRIAWARSDAFRTLILILMAASVIFFAMTKKLSTGMAIALISLISIGELWMVDKRYIFESKFVSAKKNSSHKKTAADDLILKDASHYRVLDFDNTFNQANTSYFHKTIGGYFAAKLGRYQDLVEREITPEQMRFIDGARVGRMGFDSLPALNMLNAKYFKFGDSEREVVRNNKALGNAWFVKEVKAVTSPEEEMSALANFNPATTAILDEKKFKLEERAFQADSTASIKLTLYNSRQAQYQSENTQPGLAVFSEIYYPEGWEATIDGQATDIIRVNYVLRAIKVPAGKHEIKFEFKPKSYIVGAAITKYSSMFLCLSFVLGLAFAGYQEIKGEKP